MEKEFTLLMMEKHMMAILKMITRKEKESLHGQMVKNMLESLKMI